jgi:hypothetical protein
MASPTPDELRAMLRQTTRPEPRLIAKTEQLSPDSASQSSSSQNGAPATRKPPQRVRSTSSERSQPTAVQAEARPIEQAVAAALYQYPNQCVPRFIEHGLPEFFVDPILRRFYSLLHDYFIEHKHADPNAFLQHLDDVGQLVALGGPSFVVQLLREVSPPGASFDYHLDILRDKYVARQAAASATELASRVSRINGDELWQAISDHEAAMTGLRALAADKLEGVEDFSYSALVGFDAAKDPSVLLGRYRWLGQGYTCLWAGGSGYGKSTLQMQAALYWATGTSFFGIPAARPLKSLIIQAENDLGDTGEQFQGVLAGIKAAGDVRLNGQVERMITIVRLIGATGDKFLSTLCSLLKLHKPDMVWIDPLFAFAGCDLVDTASVSKFLREGLIPIVVEHKVCAHVIHHIAKPARDNDAKKNWSSHDYQFLGFGSSEIQNAFRAVNILIPVAGHDGVFKLILSKRGSRSGAKDVHGEPSNVLFLSHAKEGMMTWSQVDEPDDAAKKGRREAKFNEKMILEEMSATDGQKASALQKHMREETGMSEKTFYRFWADLKESSRIRLDQNNLWIRKTNT